MEIFDRILHILEASPFPRFIEFGSYDGYHSEQFITMLYGLNRPFEYHVFEPKPRAISLTTATLEKVVPMVVARNGRLLFVPKAIGQIDGPITFWETEDNYPGSSSIRKPKLVFHDWPEMRFHETTVDCIRFDTHAAQEGLEGKIIDFIWCDIQGAEVDVIKGGLDTFQNVRYFFTEFVNCEHYEGEIDLPGILDLLPDFEIVEQYGKEGGDVLLGNKRLYHLDPIGQASHSSESSLS